MIRQICLHALLLSVLIPPGLIASTGTKSDTESEASADFKKYGYDRMRRFAGAYMLVSELQRRHNVAAAQLVPESTAYQALQAKTKAEMDAAIQSVRLSPEAYQAIAEATQKDPALTRQIARLVNELQQVIHTDKLPSDALDLGTLEVRGYTVTKSLMAAEMQVAFRRSISNDPADRYVLVCRKSKTTSRIPRTWCAYNGDLAAMQLDNRLSLPDRQDEEIGDSLMSIDPISLSLRWQRFFNSLPD